MSRRRLRVVLGGVVTLGVVVFAVLSLNLTDGPVHPVPPPPSDAPVQLMTYPCRPVLDRARRLQISFRLVNTGSEDVTLIAVHPVLPLGGLIPSGAATMGGNCRAPVAGPVQGVVLHGHSTLLTMRLRLPAGCAAPLPVQVSVTVRAAGPSSTTTLPVLPDLAALHDETC